MGGRTETATLDGKLDGDKIIVTLTKGNDKYVAKFSKKFQLGGSRGRTVIELKGLLEANGRNVGKGAIGFHLDARQYKGKLIAMVETDRFKQTFEVKGENTRERGVDCIRGEISADGPLQGEIKASIEEYVHRVRLTPLSFFPECASFLAVGATASSVA